MRQMTHIKRIAFIWELEMPNVLLPELLHFALYGLGAYQPQPSEETPMFACFL